MTAAAWLFLALLLPTGSFAWDIARDSSRDRTERREIARLCAQLPPARSLNPDDWPKPVSPLDLPGIGATQTLAAIELSSRVFVPAPEPLVVGLAIGGGRHHIGIAPGTSAQRARWNSSTGQFWAIVEGLSDLSEPCSHCAAPEDGEPGHAGCPGCACPCSMAVAS